MLYFLQDNKNSSTYVMFRPAPIRKWQHFRAQKSWHDTTLSRKPFFCFSSLRAKQARRRWFGVNEQTIVFRRGELAITRSMHKQKYTILFYIKTTLTFFHKPAVDGNLPPVIQHICLENSICENVAFCAQSCCFFALFCFALHNHFISAIL